ncbi:MAG TPA: Gfo/Idh/MocA family oxidoreductase [Pirellulaceae bacterium]
MIRIGIVGLGHWGPNLVRCFSELEQCKVTAVCDHDAGQLIRIRNRFPHIRPVDDFNQILDRDLVDAVVIATPTRTHHRLAAKALDHGLHTFVEKPLATTSKECHDLIARAEQNRCQLFVGHVFLHSAAVKKLRELIVTEELGRICYISCKRLNLGPVRNDVSALFDLAPHDISIMLHLLGQHPDTVSCSGLAHLNPRIHDVCNLTLHFPDNKLGIAHVSWLDPRKERVLTVVGDKKMAVYDDLDQEKIKVYDKGVSAPPGSGDYAEFQLSYRYGGSYSPWLNDAEPLKAECAEFVHCVLDGSTPQTDGHNGLRVVEVLEAADRSLRRGGHPIILKPETVQPQSTP